MTLEASKKHVLIIPDGAADRSRAGGLSPLMQARTEGMDWLARKGVTGLMQTLYPELSRGSIVAQLGMLGWDPHRYYPHGRASCELLALDDIAVGPDDLVFRVNLVTMAGSRLVSYNGNYILSEQARPLIERLRRLLGARFPAFELYHNSDFRSSLLIRGAAVDPRKLACPEPHESEGLDFDAARLISGSDLRSEQLARQINDFVAQAGEVLAGERANMVFPWSASSRLSLPSFAANTGFEGRAAIVGFMDFLHGIAKAGNIDFFKVGNGGPDTDYAAKGEAVVSLLDAGYSFVVCHVNGPDEASHMGDRRLKIASLEAIDREIVRPVVDHFLARPDQLGGVLIAPDHYTNYAAQANQRTRSEAHSLDAVPFVLWNGCERDEVERFDEESVVAGRYGEVPVNHLALLSLLGVSRVLAPGLVGSA